MLPKQTTTFPICTKCNNEAEERWMIQTKYYFCPVCRVEVDYSSDQQEIDELLLYLQDNTKLEIV